jgi:hypothetical protein
MMVSRSERRKRSKQRNKGNGQAKCKRRDVKEASRGVLRFWAVENGGSGGFKI